MSSSNIVNPVNVLLIDNCAEDISIIQDAFNKSEKISELNIIANPDEALKFLYKEDDYNDVTTPQIVILDINILKNTHNLLLKEIKNDDRLKNIPVLIIADNENEEDIINTYDLYANCFIQKPVDSSDFAHTLDVLINFWLNVVKLPHATY
ncbi:MAG: response regulator [Spirochaetales bacterium]|nr:response regulator [Spirochaetales bacterium]